jgi:signal transduction histidine kinase
MFIKLRINKMEKDKEIMSKKIDKVTNLVAYITIILFMIIQLGIVGTLNERIFSLVIMSLFLIFFRFWFPKIENSPLYINIFIFIETLIILIPIFLNFNWGVFPYLFFMLSVISMVKLLLINGIFWIIVFTLISFIIYSIQGGLYFGLIYSLIYGVGSFFFGGFGYALKISIESKEKSEKLLQELKETNEKLKEYTKKVQELTILEERNRLSREMHDSIGHHLVKVSIELEILKKILFENPDEAKKLIEVIKNEISKSLDDLRNVVKTLRKPVELELTINESLKNLINSFTSIKNIKANLEIGENILDLKEDYKLTILRVCQEALTNIEKHYNATEIWVKLKKEDNNLILTVEDNGVGFPNEIKEGSFGLIGIKERANIFNGRFLYENRKEGGARIAFSLPFKED